MSTLDKKARRHKFLSDFVYWFDNGMNNSIHNVLELRKTSGVGLNNRVLQFVIPRAMYSVPNKFILEVYQAWHLLNKELKANNMRQLYKTKEYKDLKLMRDKIVAHGIESSSESDKVKLWYQLNYGSFESVFKLIKKEEYVALARRTSIRTF